MSRNHFWGAYLADNEFQIEMKELALQQICMDFSMC